MYSSPILAESSCSFNLWEVPIAPDSYRDGTGGKGVNSQCECCRGKGAKRLTKFCVACSWTLSPEPRILTANDARLKAQGAVTGLAVLRSLLERYIAYNTSPIIHISWSCGLAVLRSLLMRHIAYYTSPIIHISWSCGLAVSSSLSPEPCIIY